MNTVLKTSLFISFLIATSFVVFNYQSTSNLKINNISIDNQQDYNKKNVTFSYFAFEREWPGTVCKVNNCKPEHMGSFDSKNFNLHGLWPSGLKHDKCDYPDFCAKSHFNFDNINKKTRNYMDSYWVGLYTRIQTFLDHEWKKHGTCYSDDQDTYFTLATNLHKKYNPIVALASSGITPSETNSYELNDIQKSLEQDFGGPVFLNCKKLNGKQMLFSVIMYFSKSLDQIIPQPCHRHSSCSDKKPVYLPVVTFENQ